MNLFQSAGVSILFLILGGFTYHQLKKSGLNALGWMTKILLLLTTILLFININLISSARQQIKDQQTIFQYTIPSTLDLVGIVHDPKNKVEMEENRIYINKDTDQARIFVVLGYPIWGILDQAKLIDLYRDLGGAGIEGGSFKTTGTTEPPAPVPEK